MFHFDLNPLPPIQHKLAKIPSDSPGRFSAFSKTAPIAPGQPGHPRPCVPAAHAAEARRCWGSRPFLRRPARPSPSGCWQWRAGTLRLEKAVALPAPSCRPRSSPLCLLLAAWGDRGGGWSLGTGSARRERLREALLDGMWLTGVRGQLRGHCRRFPLPHS